MTRRRKRDRRPRADFESLRTRLAADKHAKSLIGWGWDGISVLASGAQGTCHRYEVRRQVTQCDKED
jgi:hypothetical protein